jgi:hypothetical protein
MVFEPFGDLWLEYDGKVKAAGGGRRRGSATEEAFWGGGLRLGSGTQGLQTRTSSPPPNVALQGSGRSSSSTVRSINVRTAPSCCSDGGLTMYWRGIVIRCGEHFAHTTLPHFRQ